MARSAAHIGKTRANASKAPVSVPVPGTVLLLIDVINDLAFDGSDSSRRRNPWQRPSPASSAAPRPLTTITPFADIKTVLKGKVAPSARLSFLADRPPRTAGRR